MTRAASRPAVVVLSSLFPSERQPMAGLFVRERMFRVGRDLPLSVVAPTPWFPLQGWLRRFRPAFRPGAPHHERQAGHDVWFPRFFSVPALLKQWDGAFMALCAYPRLKRLQRQGRLDVLDAHFAYPDGYAATRLKRWLGVPVCITLRGTESRLAADPAIRPLLRQALLEADQVLAVSTSLARVAQSLDVPAAKVRVVGNGVDIDRFQPLAQDEARRRLGIPPHARVIVTVGGLVERKGFHRVMACLPELRRRHGEVLYLVVGGPSPEGDWTGRLHALRDELGLGEAVRFLGPVAPRELAPVLSAADVFALSTRHEGWANVLLEAMACGLPVVATDVGGNAEVVCRDTLGALVPFDDHNALLEALGQALLRSWDRQAIRSHALANTWDERVRTLHEIFSGLHARSSPEAVWAPMKESR